VRFFVQIQPASTTDAIVEQILKASAETALRLWPIWFTDVSFVGCRENLTPRRCLLRSRSNGKQSRNVACSITTKPL